VTSASPLSTPPSVPTYQDQVRSYREYHTSADEAEYQRRRAEYQNLVTGYFNLVTEFYLRGWGRSFHFAPRRRGESLSASIRRYEWHLADQLEINPASAALDLGCGVGGPLVEIARRTGAAIVGVNNNQYQLAKARQMLHRAGLADRCGLLEADFMRLPLPDNSQDAAYSIEAVPHAPDKRALFREVHRVLRPGGRFVATDWCLTKDFRPDDTAHRKICTDIELGNGLPGISTIEEVRDALETAGFEISSFADEATTPDVAVPWFAPLQGRPLTPMNCLRAPWGRKVVGTALRAGETLRLLPRGAAAVQQFLSQGADALVAGGLAGIFTPLVCWCARKPG
jgi:sterol 24-C-methyltransferase